ncbi:MAG: hypothetical protein M3R72_09645 [Bacteroidota bacterium]|nr:hypothetical protein [Bacteroidota bacterium]
MKEIVNKLMVIEKETSAKKGKYNLFALFLRENSSYKWDVLVSANWINDNKEKSLKYLAQKIQKSFTQNELSQISRIVIIDEDNPQLPALQQAINIEHGTTEIKDSNFFGLQIKHAFLITSRPSQVA